MKIIVHSAEETVVFEPKEPILLSDLLSLHQVPLSMPCGGRRRCMKCRIVATGCLSPMDDLEKANLSPEEIAQNVRLACMVTATGDAQITLLESAKTHVLTEGQLPQFPFNPLGKSNGVAVDIGTTTVAAYLYDLQTNTLLSTASMLNPQSGFGADVISRMEKSHNGQGDALALAIRNGLSQLLTQLCEAAKLDRKTIDAMVITGNTAMAYLLTNHPVKPIIAAPFLQDRFFGEFIKPADLDLDLPGCNGVYVTRSISAYVGGDITMSSMAAELFRKQEGDAPCLLCDIGTNGEMVLFAKGKFYCCSTAAGPTFEGAGIHMGMTAKNGAISKISLENGKFVYNVIGDIAPTGICGTGIIDGVAALLEAGVVDPTGRMVEKDHDFTDYNVKVDGKKAFQLPGTQVFITQGDIRAVQMAKAAICAGMEALLHISDMDGEVVELLIAGGFGSFIDVYSAEKIGLIPTGFAKNAHSIGNAAGSGACMVLLSQEMQSASETYSQTVETVELATNPFFVEKYTYGMMFPEE